MSTAVCVASGKSQLECDVVECYPHAGSELFACGKYHLDESGDRVGSISLYKFDQEAKSISLQSSVSRAGVLDCRWHHSIPKIITAEADGKIGLFALQENDLQFSADFQLEPESITLAVDWNTKTNSSAIGSYSDGTIVLLDCAGGSLQEQKRFIAHESAEVWAVAHSKHSPNIFYSGGDDCRLKFWDSRQELNANTPIISKRYDMGVTSIQASSYDENIIVVGSYDESVSIWDRRSCRRALTDVKVGGGVWRVKWNPEDTSIILAACMYNEFQLLQYDSSDSTIKLLGELFGSPQHEAGKLAYGADWFRSSDPSVPQYYAALCSFYDNVYSCWQFEIN